MYILYKQKMAWKAFAAKRNLRYQANTMMASPEMTGEIEGYKFSFFTSEHVSQELRGGRKMTAVEVTLRGRMPIEGAVASGVMVQLVQTLGFPAEVRLPHERWSPAWVATGEHASVLSAYLSDERVTAFSKLMQARNVSIILIFRNNVMLLRIDMPGALETVEKLEKVQKAMLTATQIFELKEGEDRRLKAVEAQKSTDVPALKLDKSDLDNAGGLRLEDEPQDHVTSPDEGAAEASVKNTDEA
ncbi:MAG: hypothetical protein IT559_02785 [Alphaproteobacteria bacterium]|nr:hypothetical protein [Alphaproteobacteria bacterium]